MGKGSSTKGANKTYQQKGDRGRMLGESDEFRRLRHAVEKASGDRERAIRYVCRLYTVNRFDALPGAIRTAILALLEETAPIIRPCRARCGVSSGEKLLGAFPCQPLR
jgi:hypothetical protein